MKKIFKYILPLCVVGLLTVGITYAGFKARKDTTNIITIGDLEVELIDIYTRPDSVGPGDNVSKIVSAENTGNNDAYIRINLEKVWTDKDGNVVEGLDPDLIEINFPNPEDWIDGGDGYYYYQRPLKAGERAENLLDSFKLSLNYKPNGNEEIEGNIIVNAEGIQADNFTPEIIDGVIVSWGDIEIKNDRYDGEIAQTVGSNLDSNVYFQEKSYEFITIEGDDLFLNFKGLMPGDDKVQNINVENKNDKTIHLYMYAAETSKDKFSSEEAKKISDELISASTIEVTAKYKDGTTKVIYSGPVHGNGKAFDMTTENAIYLGRFEKGDAATLEAKLHIPEEWTKGRAEGKVDWIFTCAEEEVPNVIPPAPPVTGDRISTKNIIILTSLSIIALGVVILGIKKKKVKL